MSLKQLTEEILADDKPESSFRAFVRAFAVNKGAVLGFLFIVLLVILALFSEYIAPYDPTYQFREYALVPPAWSEGGSTKFLLGTDDLGRDILSRIIYGTRLSIIYGLLIVGISLVIGVSLGLLAGYFGGILDIIITRVIDIIMSLPSLLVSIVVVTVLGPSIINAAIAIGLISIPAYVRQTRIAVIVEKNKDYVLASRLAGAGTMRTMFINILPNCLSPLVVQTALGFSSAILTMASLGFLGMGAQPPIPEWGTMLSESTRYMLTAWWTVTFPGLAILLTVFAFNYMGDGLRDALDPKLRQQR